MAEPAVPFRLLTRADFDGVVCATLLTQKGLIEEIRFVDPRRMQQGEEAVTDRDITANLPFVPGVHLAFDHHSSEVVRVRGRSDARFINDPNAPSCAQVIYERFGGAAGFPGIKSELMRAVNRADSARFSLGEVTEPSGYALLNFLLDGRTGLGRFRSFRVSNEELLLQMVQELPRRSADELLLLPDVSERVRLYFEHETYFRGQLQRCTQVVGRVAVVDLRREERIFAGNRFMVYALHPQATLSMQCVPVAEGAAVQFAIGRSIFNRESQLDVGELCLEYGGGGHAAAGTCQTLLADAERVKGELLDRMRREA